MRYRFSLAVFCLFTLSLFASDRPGITVTELGQLSGTDNTQTGDRFGYSTVISGDGSTMAVGAPFGSTGYAGEIYVYVKPSTGWTTATQTARLNPAAQCILGYSLAISSDGSTIVSYASPQTSGCNGGSGSSWIDVFVRPSGGWADMTAPTATLSVPNDNNLAVLDTVIAMSADAKTVLAQLYLPSAGKTYLEVFTQPAGGWVSTTSVSTSVLLPNQGGPGPIAINGSTIVQLPGDNTARVYQRTSAGLVQIATLTPSDGTQLGYYTVALNANTILLQGGLNGTNQQGKVYLYTKPSTGWTSATETAQLTVSNLKSSADFGATMSISGRSILVGGITTLAAYLFIEPTGGWVTTSTPSARIVSSDPNKKNFGNSVSIAGTTMLIGDYLAGANDSAIGAAYVYSF